MSPRVYGQMLAPAEGSEEQDEAQEAGGGFLVARSEKAELLKPVKKAFYLVALPVADAVQQAAVAVLRAGDDDLGPELLDLLDEGLGVVGLVGQPVARLGR